MAANREKVFEYMYRHAQREDRLRQLEFTTEELAAAVGISRANTSTLLNQLVQQGRVEKSEGRPVRYRLCDAPGMVRQDISCFRQMAGYDGSLKNAVQLAKAAIVYPGRSLSILLTAPTGAGTSCFARLTAQFARENGASAGRGDLVSFDCRAYADKAEGVRPALCQAFAEAAGGILFFDHAERLPRAAHDTLMEQILEAEQADDAPALLCAATEDISKTFLDRLSTVFPMHIALPPLGSRPLEERLALVKQFFNEEAGKMQHRIKLDADVLRCVLLYRCEQNVKQLHQDILLACANAYVRCRTSPDSDLRLSMADFPAHVQKGFLYYKEQRGALAEIIPQKYTYTFSGQDMAQESLPDTDTPSRSVYDIIDSRTHQLQQRGIDPESIRTILSADLSDHFKQLTDSIRARRFNRTSLGKVVDEKIIAMVDSLLAEAGEKFHRVYPESTLYGLCLHISSALEQPDRMKYLSNAQIAEIVEQNPEEFALCQRFAGTLKEAFGVEFSLDETVILTMFLSHVELAPPPEQQPVVLVAMHGASTASSMVNVVRELIRSEAIFAFDMDLAMEIDDAYAALRETIRRVDRGKGILLLYDMGSMCTMAQSISRECGIPIRTLEIPATLIALDCARKVASTSTLEEAYDSVAETYLSRYSLLSEEYRRQMENRIIITLCMSGEGGAVQIKNYLEKNMDLDDITVLPMSISDRVQLLNDVNTLKKEHQILCIVGTYDPHLLGIPFIPVSTLFETSVDKLNLLFSLDPQAAAQAGEATLDAVVAFLAEELPHLDTRTLKRTLPRLLRQLKKQGYALTNDQEMGLFMHIACAIARMQEGITALPNPNAERILARNKRLYNDLDELLAPLEISFRVSFDDNEKANIIGIIKQL